jgi:hypothetical protein
MVLSIRADSTEYATATVSADHDITAATVEVALPVTNTPPSTWYAATKVGTVQVGARWTCTYRILIGPAAGVTSLSAGNYDWTVRLTDTPGPEVPVRKVGVVTVTAT